MRVFDSVAESRLVGGSWQTPPMIEEATRQGWRLLLLLRCELLFNSIQLFLVVVEVTLSPVRNHPWLHHVQLLHQLTSIVYLLAFVSQLLALLYHGLKLVLVDSFPPSLWEDHLVWASLCDPLYFIVHLLRYNLRDLLTWDLICCFPDAFARIVAIDEPVTRRVSPCPLEIVHGYLSIDVCWTLSTITVPILAC